MAIFNHGIFSKAKNKLGGVTFQQYEGMQIGKEYQPNVKNPNTANQIAARAKFKLASQLVALYNSVLMIAGAKISIYSRYIRGAFVGVISREATYDAQVATISPQEFATAINTRVGSSEVQAPVISGSTAQNATISATAGDIVTYEVVAFDTLGNIIGRDSDSFTASDTPQAITLPLTSTTPDRYDVVAVATRAVTEEGAAIYDNIIGSYDIEVTRLIAAGDVEASNITAVTLPQS